MNKEYTKNNDKDVVKGYMEGALVGLSISVVSKETSKTSDKEFLSKLKDKSDAKLTVNSLNPKATFK